MKYKGLIFDFDYTLGDATEGIVASVNYGLKQLGHAPAEREAIRKTIGLSLEETYRVLQKASAGSQNAAAFAGYFREKADQVMTANTSFLPGVLDILRKWKDQGIFLGIVTTKYHYRIDAILEKYQEQGLFDAIVGGEDVKQPKPDPEGIFQVLEQWKLSREQVLYVGDSLVDAKTAEAAGVDFAGVTTGTTTGEALKAYPNVGVFAGVVDLSRIFT